ncbi:MAG: hypothetical protein K2J81_10690 [Treponemataceae bacterium]|nr:hypothetical protein [Treponemataceae bacterium]
MGGAASSASMGIVVAVIASAYVLYAVAVTVAEKLRKRNDKPRSENPYDKEC